MEQLILSPIPVNELVTLITNSVMNQISNQPEKAAPTPEIEGYLTRHEVCKLLNVSLVTLNKHTKSKRLQAHRIGARVLYKKSEVINSLSTIK